MRRFLIAAVGLVLIAGSFTAGAMAQSASVPQAKKIAKACTNGRHVLSLQVSGSCSGASHKAKLPLLGGPGTILGYAHINPDGSFDAANSWKVKASNVTSTSAGWYCFTGLKFTPHGASATIDYSGPKNGDVAVAQVVVPMTSNFCGLTSAQAMVFTGNVDPGVFTTATSFGFYVLFY